MYADQRLSRCSGEPRAKSTEYGVDVRSPVPRFRFERNTQTGPTDSRPFAPIRTTNHPRAALEHHLISSGVTWYHLITPNNTSPFFGPNCYFLELQLTSTNPRLRLSRLSRPVTVHVTVVASKNPCLYWFVTVSRLFTPVRPPLPCTPPAQTGRTCPLSPGRGVGVRGNWAPRFMGRGNSAPFLTKNF